MQERAIHISSIRRQKYGVSRQDDFIIKFDPVLKLAPDMMHEIAMDRLSMTYSWHNITASYENNTIKYSADSGSTWETVVFNDGMYSYDDIDKYLHNYMDKKGHAIGDRYPINILFVLSTYKVIIELDDGYQLDLRGTRFGDLIGFEEDIVSQTEYGTRLPNITNSIDVLNINCDAVSDSIVDGVNTNTLSIIPTDNLTRSYPFTYEPKRPLYCPMSSNNISQMRFNVTDALDRPVNFNGVDWFITLLVRSTYI
nr:TPA_asm: penton [Corynactis coral adintovirus]